MKLPNEMHTPSAGLLTAKGDQTLESTIHAQHGYPFRYVSEILHKNFQVTSLILALKKECSLWLFYSFVRFEHFSNGGNLWREGFTDKEVIGPETIVLGIGMWFPWK
jgi:hypothetical protein